MSNSYILSLQKQEELRKNKYIVVKYDRPGIYSISINNILVYIGKSQNMLNRLASHIVNIDIEKGHKYQIFRQAQERGIPIAFGVLYYANSQDTEEELGYQEGRYIREYLPFLNTQIPKEEDWHRWTTNWSANSISLDEILKRGQSKKTV